MPIPIRLAAMCLSLVAFFAHAQTSPRTQVDGVASAIEQNYFDAVRGKKIAGDLRAAAARGEFDALTDRTALAAELSGRLKPFDGHFHVRWQPSGAAPDRAGPKPRPARVIANYGIRSVEVLPGGIGYLSMEEFAEFEFDRNDQPARDAIDAALQRLAGSKAVIVDLRGNRGGAPSMVGYLISAFVAPGAKIYNTFHTRTESFDEAPLEPYRNPRTKVPLYVLIGAGTGSAAEAFAYTLKYAKRATVVGQVSDGVANPGDEVDAGQGFSVFVANGSPVNPITGGNWEGTGVLPDVVVASQSALETALGLARKP